MEELDKAVADAKDLQAKLVPAPAPDSVSFESITGGLGTLERAQMAVDRMFGLTREKMLALAKMENLRHRPLFADLRSTQDYQDFDSVPAFESLREMYQFFTGDSKVDGIFNRKNLPADLRARMDITSATFTFILGNTMGRRLVSQYREWDYGEQWLISVRKPVNDFRLQEAVLVGGFADLATVDPEVADYQEIAAVTDEESTYTVLQKGNILSISRKTIINDEINVITRLVQNLARSARRTHAKYVWNFFVNNSNCTDGTAWFTAGHGNLGAVALDIPHALIAYIALGKMTEKDSAERLGLMAPDIKPTIVCPVDCVQLATSVAQDEVYYTANDLTTKTHNPLLNKVNVVVCPLLTDTNDWGMLMPPDVVDIVEMGYLNGRQDPEMFLADMPQSEQVFVADKIRYKIRHEYAGAVIDYRSGYKNVV
jgi:hypothetical protein